MNHKVIIISGGTLDEQFVLTVLAQNPDSLVIGVDSGLNFLKQERIVPELIVGDFDSVAPDVLLYYEQMDQVSVRRFDPVKDASDTEIALAEALQMKSDEILILGGTGSRMDHVWANVQCLKRAHDAGVKAKILDPHNCIYLAEKEVRLRRSEMFGDYFSVFPLGSVIEHFYIKGAKYPLNDHRLTPYDSLCVSNELTEEEVVISFSEGIVVLMETKD